MRRGALSVLLFLPLLAGCRHSDELAAVGTLERHRIELRAERQEAIVDIPVREGEHVEAGDTVVALDPRRVTAERDQALASRNLSAARLAEVVRGSREEDVERAQAEFEEAAAALVELEPELERMRKLVSEGIQSQSELDVVEAAHSAAHARRDASRAALERQLRGSTAEELDQAQAELERSQAELARLEIDLERMTVASPRAGTVDALPFRVGDQPPVGATVAVVLAEDAPFAHVYVPAEVRPSVMAGQQVRVHVDGFEQTFEGRVRMISSEAAFTPYYSLTERDRQHFSYLAEIDLVEESARDLPTGLSVEVVF